MENRSFYHEIFDHTENTIVNLNADDFADYMLSDFHVMECMVDNLSAVCDYFDKVAKFNKKSLMIPDSLYLDMMIDISDGQQFCFDEDGFEFLNTKNMAVSCYDLPSFLLQLLVRNSVMEIFGGTF